MQKAANSAYQTLFQQESFKYESLGGAIYCSNITEQ